MGGFSTAEAASRAVYAARILAAPSAYNAWVSGAYVEDPRLRRLRDAAAGARAAAVLPPGADTRRVRFRRGLYHVTLPGGGGHATIEEARAAEQELAAKRLARQACPSPFSTATPCFRQASSKLCP